MGAYIGVSDERNFDAVELGGLGCPGCGSLGEPITIGAVASAVSGILNSGILGKLFGGSRDEKRKKRDQALNELYSMGMDRDIYLNHSDHFGVVQGLAELAKEYGQVVISVLNQNIERTTDNNGRTNRWIYSAKSPQFSMLEQKLTAAIAAEQQQQSNFPAIPGFPGQASQAGFGTALKHPAVIASGVIGAGAIAYTLLKD